MVNTESKNGSSAAAATGTKKRVFVVDDHPIVRQGLVQLVNSQIDLATCGEGEDVYQSLASIRQLKPDLVLMDVSLKDGDGLELIKEIRAFNAILPILMLSMHDEALYTERALRAGANGYIMKQEAPQMLLAAMRKVLSGQVYVSDKMSTTLLQQMVGKKGLGELPMDRLTDRELEVFRMIGSGLTVKAIAEKLCLSVKTIEAHREHIKEKLNFRTSAELLRFAIQNSPDSRG